MQAFVHAPAEQCPGVHAVAAGTMQLPMPLQVPAGIRDSMSVLHPGAAHWVFESTLAQVGPPPAHLPTVGIEGLTAAFV